VILCDFGCFLAILDNLGRPGHPDAGEFVGENEPKTFQNHLKTVKNS
jgi:hypothetical protein